MTDKIFELKEKRLHPYKKQIISEHTPKTRTKTNKIILHVENLSVSYDKTMALQPLCFDLSSGQTLAVIGTSGSGKTSLANGLIKLTKARGKVFYQNKEK